MTDKTKRHWQVLRNALLRSASPASSQGTSSSIATEFFPVFSEQEAPNHPQAAAPDHVWMQYTLENGQHAVLVHEKRKDVTRVSIAEILSHKLNRGVDNTGNIRTWPSEEILLAYLLRSGVCAAAQRQEEGKLLPLTCCELGGGMAGLASLGLRACAPVPLQRVLVTDGNPLCVKNLQLCVDENRKQKLIPGQVDAELLRWDRNAELRSDLLHQFDLVLASDCLFFEEFHEDLAHTIKSLLRPQSGRCLLLQPSRNQSMERFCTVAERFGFTVLTSTDYDPNIVRKHHEHLQSRPDYVPDVHWPVLLTLSIN